MSTRFNTTSAVCLQDVINTLPGELIGLELGVWTGHNMCHLLDTCPSIVKLYGVDPYKPYQDWNRYISDEVMLDAMNTALTNLSNFPNRYELIRQTSIDTSNEFMDGWLDFIFIDGDHSFENCYQDLNLWYSKVKKGGLFSGHDFSLPGVNKALLQFRTERKIFGNFKVIPNDVWYWIKD